MERCGFGTDSDEPTNSGYRKEVTSMSVSTVERCIQFGRWKTFLRKYCHLERRTAGWPGESFHRIAAS